MRPARLLPPPAVPGQPQAPPGAILPPLPPNAHHIVHPAPPGGGGGPPTAIALPGIAAPHSLQDGVDNKLIVSVVPAPPAGINSNQEVLAPKSKQGMKNYFGELLNKNKIPSLFFIVCYCQNSGQIIDFYKIRYLDMYQSDTFSLISVASFFKSYI